MLKPVSGFSNKNGFKNNDESEKDIGATFVEGVVAILVAVMIILVSGFLVKFLWNNSMPYMFATARPVSSVLTVYAFMLMIYFVL